ncbi:MAG: aminoglycoside phosphotransferase family protein [Planctomycetota bacterium]
MTHEPEIAARLEACLASPPVAFHAVTGGYTQAGRARVELARGETVFAKWAVDELSAGWLRDERRIYGRLEADFVPRLVAWDEFRGALPLLVIEDLGAGLWPPPWSAALAERGVDALRRVAATPPPDGLGHLTAMEEGLRGWRALEPERERFLTLDVASRRWAERALPALLAAEEATSFEGEALLHLDARGDNMAFLPERVAFVDWNWACRGPAAIDVDYFAIHVHATGGPSPEELGAPGDFAALLVGYFANQASLPPIPTAPGVRPVQLQHLLAALPWAARTLGLEPPDGPLLAGS